MQRGFTVKEVGFAVKDAWPALPPLHSTRHPPPDLQGLERPASAEPHPSTPHQYELQRLRLTPSRGKHHHGRGAAPRRCQEAEDSHTPRLRSHDSATSTDDEFGGRLHGLYCTVYHTLP